MNVDGHHHQFVRHTYTQAIHVHTATPLNNKNQSANLPATLSWTNSTTGRLYIDLARSQPGRKMKIRFIELALETFGYLFVIQYICWVNGSEFPERECCDAIYSSPPDPEPVQPTRSSSTSLTQYDPQAFPNNRTGEFSRNRKTIIFYFHLISSQDFFSWNVDIIQLIGNHFYDIRCSILGIFVVYLMLHYSRLFAVSFYVECGILWEMRLLFKSL